jgi:hypothetical protein
VGYVWGGGLGDVWELANVGCEIAGFHLNQGLYARMWV